jgi:hypothetical protein
MQELTLATDLCLAALVGDGVYNFGEVVRQLPAQSIFLCVCAVYIPSHPSPCLAVAHAAGDPHHGQAFRLSGGMAQSTHAGFLQRGRGLLQWYPPGFTTCRAAGRGLQ